MYPFLALNGLPGIVRLLSYQIDPFSQRLYLIYPYYKGLRADSAGRHLCFCAATGGDLEARCQELRSKGSCVPEQQLLKWSACLRPPTTC